MYNKVMTNSSAKIHSGLIMVGLGFLIVLSLGSFFHEINEARDFSTIFLSIVILALGIFIAQKFAKHLACGCDHTHSTDKVFIGSLVAASFIHTLFDGGIFHLTIKEEGIISIFLVALTIILHEILRMSTLMSVLSDMGYSKKSRWGYVFLVSVSGFAFGLALSFLLDGKIEQMEGVAHLVIGFLYSIIATDIFIFTKNRYKINYYLVTLGAIIGILLEIVHSH